MRRLFVAVILIAALATGVVGCAGTSRPADGRRPAAGTSPMRIGTLPTEDALPLWVAERDGVFEKVGLTDVSIVVFESARERDAALVAGEIDALVGDLIAAAELEAGGTAVAVPMVMLGSTPSEGRFGIVSAPGSGIATLTQLGDVPVGTSSGTIQEYVLDCLMRRAGVEAARVKKQEVESVSARYDLLIRGRIRAAALPEPFLTLAVEEGAILVADDTTGENLSQSVLVVSDSFVRESERTVMAFMDAWDLGAQAVNVDPDAYRAILVERARFPETVEDIYRIQLYPIAAPPAGDRVEAILQWMRTKGLLEGDEVTFESLWLSKP